MKIEKNLMNITIIQEQNRITQMKNNYYLTKNNIALTNYINNRKERIDNLILFKVTLDDNVRRLTKHIINFNLEYKEINQTASNHLYDIFNKRFRTWFEFREYFKSKYLKK